jgi:ribonuclease Z
MELIFLGTSSALPTKHRNHSSMALKSFGEILLFDCGEGTQLQMSKVKLSPMKIGKIFITHFHGDHFLGLPGIIQSMAFRGRTEQLHIFGPKGLFKIMDNIINLGYFSLSFDIHAHEVKNGVVFEEEDYKVSCCRMDHIIPNIAYSIDENRSPKFIKEKAIAYGVAPGPDFGKLQRGIIVKVGKNVIKPEYVLGKERKGRKIVYSGDTRPCEQMIKFADNSDILIHEATFRDDYDAKAFKTGHSTAQQAAKIAKKAKVKRLILTHLSSRYQESNLLENEARKVFMNSSVAEDFMKIKVKLNGD